MEKSRSIEILSELDKVQLLLSDAENRGKMSAIERDMVLDRLRRIYESVLRSEMQEIQVPIAEPARTIVEPLKKEVHEPRQHQASKETMPTPEPVIELSPEPETIAESSKVPPPPVVPTIEKKKDVISQPEVKVEIPKEEKHAPKEPTHKKEILAETFEKTKFLNDILAQYGNTNDLSKKFQHQPINDIFKAIGINEKFLFVKDLFDGNADRYTQTLTFINEASSFNEAIEYLDRQFKWDFENPVVQKLLELVHRRHGKE
jgi:hypothetical protein